MGKPLRVGYARSIQAAALVLSAGSMAGGIGCAFLAWTRESLPFGVTSVVLFLAAPPVAVLASLARGSVASPAGRVCADTLIDDLHRAHSTLWIIGRARAHLGVAAASTFVVWVCEAFGLTEARDFAICLTLLVASATAGYLPWLARLERLTQALRERTQRQLDEISVADKWFAG